MSNSRPCLLLWHLSRCGIRYFSLMYDGGRLRREEVVLLELTDIDWAHREVTLRPEICKNGSGAGPLYAGDGNPLACLPGTSPPDQGWPGASVSLRVRPQPSLGHLPGDDQQNHANHCSSRRTSAISSTHPAPSALNAYGSLRDRRTDHR